MPDHIRFSEQTLTPRDQAEALTYQVWSELRYLAQLPSDAYCAETLEYLDEMAVSIQIIQAKLKGRTD